MAFKPVDYLKETWEELGKVTWPSRTEVIKMSLMVMVVSAVIAAFISSLDIFLAEFISKLLNLQFN